MGESRHGSHVLLLRADATAEMGTGHIMRCLALAQAWLDAGGSACFLSGELASPLQARLRSEGMGIVVRSADQPQRADSMDAVPGSEADAAQTAALARQLGAAWLAVDGYQFGSAYQRAIKQSGTRLLVIDDYGHAGHYCPDYVLNQNIYATEEMYVNRAPDTRLLLGTRFALLRREFWPWRGRRREIASVARKVLITLGGADTGNVTLTAIQAVAQMRVGALELCVVVGGNNPHCEVLQSTLGSLPFPAHLERNATDMAKRMAWADVAISAGGTTCWELALMGLPSVVLILAENQRPVSAGLAEAGVTLNAGWQADVTPAGLACILRRLLADRQLRAEMSHRGQVLVDGFGAERVVGCLGRVSQL